MRSKLTSFLEFEKLLEDQHTISSEEPNFREFKKSLEYFFLDKQYKSVPKGIAEMTYSGPDNVLNKLFFVENGMGYEYEVLPQKIENGKIELRYRMLHPFYQTPFTESLHESLDAIDTKNIRWYWFSSFFEELIDAFPFKWKDKPKKSSDDYSRGIVMDVVMAAVEGIYIDYNDLTEETGLSVDACVKKIDEVYQKWKPYVKAKKEDGEYVKFSPCTKPGVNPPDSLVQQFVKDHPEIRGISLAKDLGIGEN